MALYKLLRPLAFALDAETAHRATITALSLSPLLPLPSFESALAQQVAGLEFPSPIGLAAGFDKDAEAPDAMLGLGFGFVEVGTITPQPQQGNPKPRLFRLKEDHAVINRMGFNNAGQAAAHRHRLDERPPEGHARGEEGHVLEHVDDGVEDGVVVERRDVPEVHDPEPDEESRPGARERAERPLDPLKPARDRAHDHA